MSQNTENIEAKLCAYIDGELDEAGRAEIEKHLASNPQHRKLLDELTTTHQLLVELPRAGAPPEILESMQSQLERSVLLSESGAEAASAALRVSRWPQYSAAAAIVLLAVGLGAVVYFVLPDGSHQAQFSVAEPPPVASVDGAVSDDDFFNDELALTPAAPTVTGPPPTEAPETVAMKDSSPLVETAAKSADPGATAGTLSLEQQPARPSELRFAKGGAGGNGAEGVVVNGSAELRGVDPFGQQSKVLAENTPPLEGVASVASAADKNTMFMVVSTADATVTNSQVTSFLDSNRIHWEAVDEPMPNPMDPDAMRRASAARLKQRILELKMNEALKPTAGDVAAAPSTAPAQAQIAEPAESQAIDPTSTVSAKTGTVGERFAAKPAQPPVDATPGVEPADQDQRQSEVSQSQVADGERAEEPPLAQEKIATAQVSEPALRQQAEQVQQQRQPQQPRQEQYQYSSEEKAAARDNYYIARGVTKQQAAELYQRLNAEPPQLQRAAVIDGEDAPGAAVVAMNEPQSAHQLGEDADQDPARRADGSRELDVAFATSGVSAPAATQPTVEVNAPGGESAVLRAQDMILVSIDETVDPALRTRTQTIAEDGSITLPRLGRIAAAGLTPQQLEEAIATACRENNLNIAGNAPIAVRKLGAAEPTTQPAAQFQAVNQQEIPQQLRQELTLTQTTTAPTFKAPAAAEANVAQQGQPSPADDEKLDVVIVVQNRIAGDQAPPSATTTQPTTAPVEE